MLQTPENKAHLKKAIDIAEKSKLVIHDVVFAE